jgi:hypothetical protein
MECEFQGVALVKKFTDAPIPWPMVLPVGKRGRASVARCGSLLDAVKVESAFAITHWFGLSKIQVFKLRKEYGVKANTPGSSRLRKLTPPLTQTKGQLEKFAASGTQALREKYGWKPHELALLGKHSDRQVGEMVGRTAKAVSNMRFKLRIPAPPIGKGRRWTSEEDRVICELAPFDAAERLGDRTVPEIRSRLHRLRHSAQRTQKTIEIT